MRHDIFLSLFSDLQWQFLLHATHTEDESRCIKGGDYIKLKHTELGYYLTADVSYTKEGAPEAYLRKYYGEYVEEEESLNSIWVIEYDKAFKRGDYCYLRDKE